MPPRFYSLFLLDKIDTLNGLPGADAILDGSKQHKTNGRLGCRFRHGVARD
jgi:hypothetical protein